MRIAAITAEMLNSRVRKPVIFSAGRNRPPAL
jgi:hypothetical protein